MIDRQALEGLFRARGYKDFRWIDPKSIVVGHWVRMKCRFGCGAYGRCAACPPEVPSVEDCERFFRNYKTAAVFHFEKTVAKPEDRHAWTKSVNDKLLELEREVFLAGHRKAFLLPMDSCALCEQCTGRRATCKEPWRARPTPDALAMDVYATVRSIGYPIEVLADYKQAEEEIKMLLEAAIRAPSACNRQTWRFVIVRKREAIEVLYRAASSSTQHQAFVKKARVIIVVCADLRPYKRTPYRERGECLFALQETAAAI